MPVDKVRKLINAIDDNKTEFNSPPFISKKLRKLLEIPESNNSIDELKQQMNNEFREIRSQINDIKEQMDNCINNNYKINDKITENEEQITTAQQAQPRRRKRREKNKKLN